MQTYMYMYVLVTRDQQTDNFLDVLWNSIKRIIHKEYVGIFQHTVCIILVLQCISDIHFII